MTIGTLELKRGDLFIWGSILIFAAGNSVVRLLFDLGAIIFFCVASYLFGFGYFQDAFSPFLRQWMVVYGAVVVMLG